MKKQFFLFMLLVCAACGNAWATKLYATYGTPASSGAWDAENNSYSWSAGYSNLMTIFTFPNGELAEYTSLHLTTSDYTSTYRVCFMNGSTAVATIAFYSAGQKDLVLSERSETKDIDLSKITHISFGGASGSGSVGLANVYLQKPMTFDIDEKGQLVIDKSDLVASGCLSLNEQTGELTSTLGEDGAPTWGRLSINLPEGGADLSNLTGFTVNQTGTVLFSNFEIGNKGFWSNIMGRSDLANYVADFGDPTQVTTWRWNVSTAGSQTISSVTLQFAVMTASNPHETPLTSAMFTGGCENHFGEAVGQGATIYGNSSVLADQYADLSGYDEMRIYGTPGKKIRLLFNWSSDNQKEITGDDVKLDENGFYSVDLTSLPAQQLNAFKFPWDGQTGTITKVVLYKESVPVSYSYVISGAGEMAPSVKAALADATATSIDATGLSKAMSLTTANPNCLIVADEGMVTNGQNVVVEGTCANLVLTDGYPFALPLDVTATAASYSRNMPNRFGTICLPFAVTAGNGVKYYTTNGVENDKLQLTEVGTVPAGSPAIVFTESESLGVNGSGDLATAAASNGTVSMAGSFTEEVLSVAGEELNYYGIADNTFMQATETLTVKPFRAYLTASKSAGTKIRLVQPEATAIGTLTAEGAGVEAIFNANGVKQNGLQKGLNIVKMSNGTTSKIYVK